MNRDTQVEVLQRSRAAHIADADRSRRQQSKIRYVHGARKKQIDQAAAGLALRLGEAEQLLLLLNCSRRPLTERPAENIEHYFLLAVTES